MDRQVGTVTDNVGPSTWDRVCEEQVERLELERATLSSILDSMADGLVLADADGHLIYWNGRIAELLGTSLPLHVGMPAAEFKHLLSQHIADPEQGLNNLQCSSDELHRRPRLDLRIVGARPLTLQAMQFPIHGPQGEDWGCGLILRDVTEQRQVDQIRASLLAAVSHELRAPLSSIKGFASTLLRPDVSWDVDKQREFLTIIDEESDRLAGLVDELLDTSRLVLGGFKIEPEVLDLAPLLERIVAQARSQAPQHRFALEIAGEPKPVWAEPRRIQQVLHNLVDNAIKYSAPGGEITVRCRPQDDTLVVSVTDQGEGIPHEEQSLVFEPFYRGQSPERAQKAGLGLGLTICRGYVEAHGGHIWVTSAPRQGSTFSFSLPVYQPRAARPPAEATGNVDA